jgi:IS5 family transposase
MNSFMSYGLDLAYGRLEMIGDPLSGIGSQIKWEAFASKMQAMYNNKTDKGGRLNFDTILMIKILVLQQWYSLSDQAMEREIANNLSFMKFLCYPETIPDSTTIWLFRERLKETGKIDAIWQELQRQLDEMNLKVKKGVIQDATFITSDPGHAKSDVPRGDEAKTRRSRDGTWAKKGDKSFFGYKFHVEIDTDFGLIRATETTTANVHDSQVDLAKEGEVRYGDKGYFGAKTKGYDASMKRATRGHTLSYKDELRNKRISRKRSPVERCFAFTKRICRAGHVVVTTVTRTNVKMVVTAIVFNLRHLNFALGKVKA